MKGLYKGHYKINFYVYFGSQDSIVGTVTCYWLDSPGLKPWWGQQIFSITYPFRQALGPMQPTLQWVPDLLPGGEVAGPYS
jgi:hypothetical protein